MNFLVFYSQTYFDHISLVFYYFELIYFFNDRCIYGQVRMGFFWGVWSPPPPKKMVYIFRVIKINLSFGGLKIFQMAQNVNYIQLISYIFIVRKIISKKVKGRGYKSHHFKNEKKIPCVINFLRRPPPSPSKNGL